MQFKGKSRFDGKNRLRPQNTHKVIHSFCGQLGEALFYRGFARRKADCQQLLRPSETACGGISSARRRFFRRPSCLSDGCRAALRPLRFGRRFFNRKNIAMI